MKTAIVLLCLVGVAWSEVCTVNDDCVTTQCASGSQVICQHPDGAGISNNGGLCTCQDSTQGECVTASDCYGNNAPSLNCPDSGRHCYDNVCICDRFPIGGRRSTTEE